MSEIKRVSLTTLEPQRDSDKVIKKPSKTIRISVSLPESNEDKCPEYNYKDELAAVKRKSKQPKSVPENVENGLDDPFGIEDDDVRRIAMEMEEKYGSTKKKRKGRKDDYADIGMGYDESDSFIDNTDGYDEIIPQNVTTLHGGFYINCGALEFKTDDEASSDFSSSSDSDANEKPTEKHVNRKRVLETSDEDDEDESAKSSHIEKKPKFSNSKNNLQQAIKKKLFSQNKIQVKKRRPIDPLKKTVKELLREKRQDLNMSLPADVVTENGDVEGSEKDPLKENKKPMSITSVTDAIESVVKATIDVSSKVDYDDNGNKHSADVNMKEFVSKTVVDAPSSFEGESSHESTKIEKVEIVKLPENLPEDIIEITENIKRAAATNRDGKVKFFTDEVNDMLLKLERKCKCLGKPSRSKVYEHLSPFVKCRKETLIRRAKNLVLEDEQKKLKKLLVLLKDEIDKIMPSLLASYESESIRIVQKKFSQESIDNEENKALRMPKRRFQWTEETKKHMKDLLFTKKRCFLLEGKQKETYDEQITLFLKSEVQPLWPEGWISMVALKKMCSSLSDSNKHSPNNSLNLSQTNSNLSIIPVNSSSTLKNNHSKLETVPNDITVSKINHVVTPSQKLPESTITPTSNSSAIKHEERTSSNFDIKKIIENTAKQPKHLELLPKSMDSSVIVVNSTHKEECSARARTPVIEKESCVKETNSVIEASHCQVIDLTEMEPRRKPGPKSKTRPLIEEQKPLKLTREPLDNFINPLSKDYFIDVNKSDSSEAKRKQIPTKCKTVRPLEEPRPLKLTTKEPSDIYVSPPPLPPPPSKDYYADVSKLSAKHPELSVTPNFYTSSPNVDLAGSRSDGDDIQKVMENLKALQKLSSPIKSENSTSSPVSVIAYNKNFSPKSNSSQSSTQRTDFNNKGDFTSSFQDEFQKQLFNSLSQLSTPTSSKTNYNRCS